MENPNTPNQTPPPIDERPFTFGEKLMRIKSNETDSSERNSDISLVKKKLAHLADMLNEKRNSTNDPELKRLCSVAITELQAAKMWAVDALTYGL